MVIPNGRFYVSFFLPLDVTTNLPSLHNNCGLIMTHLGTNWYLTCLTVLFFAFIFFAFCLFVFVCWNILLVVFSMNKNQSYLIIGTFLSDIYCLMKHHLGLILPTEKSRIRIFFVGKVRKFGIRQFLCQETWEHIFLVL